MSKHTRINRFPYTKMACDIYGCNNYAEFSIHRQDIKAGESLNLCEECVLAMVNNLPGNLQEKVSVPDVSEQDNGNTPEVPEQAMAQIQTEGDKSVSTTPNQVEQISDSAQNLSKAQLESRKLQLENQEQPQPESKEEVDDMNLPLNDHQALENQEQPLPEEKNPQNAMSHEEQKEKAVEVLGKQTVDELRDKAKELDIPKYYDMRKDELTNAIAEKELNNGK